MLLPVSLAGCFLLHLLVVSRWGVAGGACTPFLCDHSHVSASLSPWFTCYNGSLLVCNEPLDLSAGSRRELVEFRQLQGMILRCAVGQSMAEANISEADILDRHWMRTLRIERCELEKLSLDISRAGFFEVSLRSNRLASVADLDLQVYIDESPVLSLDLSDNSIESVDGLMNLSHFWVTALKHLSLEGNKIVSLKENTFQHLPAWADYINLSRNQIQQLPRLGLQNSTFGLTLLLHDNAITGIAEGALEGVKIKRLDLSNNSLAEVSADAFAGVVYLSELNLSGNIIVEIEMGAFDDIVGLRILDLSSNRLAQISGNIFVELPHLRWLNLADNSITPIEHGAFAGLDLETLDLSGNPLLEIPGQVFSQLRVTTLRISECYLSRFPAEGVAKLSQSLRSLDLSRNSLRQLFIPEDSSSASITVLSLLDVSNNYLDSFNCSLLSSSFPLLTRLLLNDNVLRDIEKCWSMMRLRVTLRGNHLSCCELGWLRALHVMLGVVSDAEEVWCTWPRMHRFLAGDADFTKLCTEATSQATPPQLGPDNGTDLVYHRQDGALSGNKTGNKLNTRSQSLVEKFQRASNPVADSVQTRRKPIELNYRQVAAANHEWAELQRRLGSNFGNSSERARAARRNGALIGLAFIVALHMLVGLVMVSLYCSLQA